MKKIVLIFWMSLLAWSAAMAIPSKPGLKPFTQSDGTVINIQLIGDESYYCRATSDGLMVNRNEQGDWYYTTAAGLTTTMAHDPAARSQSEKAFVAAERDRITHNPDVAAKTRRLIKRVKDMRKASEIPTKGTVRIPILLVDFPDLKMVHTKSDFEAHYITAAKSARQYFVDQSNGQFNPQFELYGIYTLQKKRSYYGEDTEEVVDAHLGEMVAEAVTTATNQDEVDWANYDNTGDGYCDMVIVAYAGVSEAQTYGEVTDAIWPCQFYLSGAKELFDDGPGELTIGGKKIDKFAVFNEILGEYEKGTELDGIGTFCHEFSHCLGLTDYYDTAYGGHFGMGNWSLMGRGSYYDESRTPCGYSAYDKNALGWLDLTTPTEDTKYTLNPLNPAGGGCGNAIKVQSPINENECLVLENRQKAGWDEFLPCNGLLIFHVNYDAEIFGRGEVNNGDIQRMTIEPADNMLSVNTHASDTWGHAQHDFNASSTPAAKWWTTAEGELTGNAATIDKPITGIEQHADGTVSLWYANAANPMAPVAAAPEVQNSRFTAKWEHDGTKPVSYTLEAHRLVAGTPIVDWSFSSFESVLDIEGYLADCTARCAEFLPEGWDATTYFFIIHGHAMLNNGAIRTRDYDLRGCENVTISITGARRFAEEPSGVTVATSKGSTDVNFTSNTDTTITVTLPVNGDQNERIFLYCIDLPLISHITIWAGDDAITATAPMMIPAESGDNILRTVTGITANEYVLRDLTPGATYLYRVKAVYANGSESDWSANAKAVLNGTDTDAGVGDVNGDGKIDVADVDVLVAYLLDKNTRLIIANADINGDGTYNAADVSALVSKIIGN